MDGLLAPEEAARARWEPRPPRTVRRLDIGLGPFIGSALSPCAIPNAPSVRRLFRSTAALGPKRRGKAKKDLGTGLKFFKRTALFLKILILQLKWSYPPDRQQSGNGSAKIFLAVSCGGFLPSYVKFRH